MSKEIAIVGCGIFGANIALKLQEEGFSVSIFEKNKEPLMGASYNNQNRLHLGFHYPRDMKTARQCIKGFNLFKDKFSESIRQVGSNCYFIASEGSFTTADEYLTFCEELGVGFERLALDNLNVDVKKIDLGVKCPEIVYDSSILRKIILERFEENQIALSLNTSVDSILKKNDNWQLALSNGKNEVFDAVINSSYADINRLTGELGYSVNENQYEYTAVPIIETDFNDAGITIMDGPFLTVLPFGKSHHSLLYHVEHTVIDRKTQLFLPPEWLDKKTSPFVNVDKQAFFEEMKEACVAYIPALHNARLVGFLEGPRMVLANKDATDERPSIVNIYDDSYLTVFSGKIDHCMWVADDVVTQMNTIFK